MTPACRFSDRISINEEEVCENVNQALLGRHWPQPNSRAG
jgi:hypothetical protein